MALNNSQNGWNEYSKLVIAELERLNERSGMMQIYQNPELKKSIL